jgi:fused signal recognition particle receptor
MSFLKRLFGKEKKEDLQDEQITAEENREDSLVDYLSKEEVTQNENNEYLEEKSDELELDKKENEKIILEDLTENSTNENALDSEDAVNEVIIEENLTADVSFQTAMNEEAHQEDALPKKEKLFDKLFKGLTKTRDNFLHNVEGVLNSFKKIDEELYEELEETLIMADFGVETSLEIIQKLREQVKQQKITEPQMIQSLLKEIITQMLTSQEATPLLISDKPNIILVIGVNGVGKTTTIGKLSYQLKQEGKKVILAAADTFRAAAIEQLQIWAERAQVDLIKHTEGADPASVVYDGIQAAKTRKADVLICDTAGRLQNKTNLMRELEKIGRIIDRDYPEAHKEVLIVLDATTGQNAISQVKVFKEAAHVTGIILTKLDGTAKGGAVVGICQSMGVPVKYIGVGEKIEDLQPFDSHTFAEALFDGKH